MSVMAINNMFKHSRLSALPPTLAGCDVQGLVARWLLDGSLTDQVSGRALTRVGTWNTTGYNMVWDIELNQFVPVFTGSNYYTFNPAAHSGHAAFPSGKSAGTVTCWAKWRATDNATPIAYGAGATDQARGIYVYSSAIQAWYVNGGVSSGINPLSDGTWHHCVFSYNGSTVSNIVDGILQATVSRTLNTALTLGEIGRFFTGNAMVGYVADCRVYSEALSAARIEAIALGRA